MEKMNGPDKRVLNLGVSLTDEEVSQAIRESENPELMRKVLKMSRVDR